MLRCDRTKFGVQILLLIVGLTHNIIATANELSGVEGNAGINVSKEKYELLERAYSRVILSEARDDPKNRITLAIDATVANKYGEFFPGEKVHEIDFENMGDLADYHIAKLAFLREKRLIEQLARDQKRKSADATADDVSAELLTSMLSGPFNIVRNHNWDLAHANEKAQFNKEPISVYLWLKFGQLGYLTGVQKFVAQQFTESFAKMPRGEGEGTNIFGILPGKNWGTPQDRITIVASHYDTVENSPGFNDNGSGMASLLEIARILALQRHSEKCRRANNTVILLALDLEEYGTQGAMAFVHDVLIRTILKPFKFPEVQGVYVLDSLMTYDPTPGAQKVPYSFEKSMPKFSRDVNDEGKIGDFIGLIGRPEDQELMDKFTYYWQNDKTPGKGFRVKSMVLPADVNGYFPSVDTLTDNSNFIRSDHVRFWIANHIDYFASFRGLHVTDTGPARGVMGKCYHAECDEASRNETMHFANLDFLMKTTRTMIRVLQDISEARCLVDGFNLNQSSGSTNRSPRQASYNFYDKTLKSVIRGVNPFEPPKPPPEPEPEPVVEDNIIPDAIEPRMAAPDSEPETMTNAHHVYQGHGSKLSQYTKPVPKPTIQYHFQVMHPPMVQTLPYHQPQPQYFHMPRFVPKMNPFLPQFPRPYPVQYYRNLPVILYPHRQLMF